PAFSAGWGTPGRFGSSSRGGASAWGATRAGSGGRRWDTSSSMPASPGGRLAQSELRLAPGERVVDRDAFDDLAAEGHGEDVIVRPGDRVRHAKFGRGVVERVETGAAPSVVARFPGYGSKRILAQFLEFE